MLQLKKVMRVLILTLMILLALSGVGLVGGFLNTKERYYDNEIRMEQIDKKKSETTEEKDKSRE